MNLFRGNKNNNEENSIKYILRILDEFKMSKNPRLLPVLFRSVLLSNDEVKIQVIREIKEYMMGVDKRDYYYIDNVFREAIGAQYEVMTSKFIQIKDLDVKGLAKEEYVILLGFGTFHHDGWLREAALKELLKCDSELKVPFILIRSCDWVLNIREVSKNEVDKLINNNLKTVLESIPLIERLKRISRFNYKNIMEKIDIEFNEEDIWNYVSYAVNCKDKYFREFLIIRIINSSVLEIEDKIKIIKSEEIPTVRLKAINTLLENISKEDLIAYNSFLLEDNFSKIKSNILYKLYTMKLLNNVEFLIPYTVDTKNSIREDSRFYIKKLGQFDFMDFYKKHLPLKGAILGLCDLADKEELDIIKGLLKNSKGKVAKKIINTMVSIDADECKDTLYEALIGSNIKHSNQSRKASLKNKISYDVEKMYYEFRTTNYEHVKINLSHILCSNRKWIAIPYILECHESKNKEIIKIARKALENWLLTFNYNYDKVSDKQRLVINESIEAYQNYIPRKQLELIKFYIK